MHAEVSIDTEQASDASRIPSAERVDDISTSIPQEPVAARTERPVLKVPRGTYHLGEGIWPAPT